MSHKRMRTVTNYFLGNSLKNHNFLEYSLYKNLFSVNLSIADTMVSSLNIPFNFVYMLNGNWPFGNIYCKICCYISMVSVCGSVFTLVAISGDR
jgi:tachykinin receptor 3